MEKQRPFGLRRCNGFLLRFGLDWLGTVQQEADHLMAERKAFQEVGKCQRVVFFEARSRCNLVQHLLLMKFCWRAKTAGRLSIRIDGETGGVPRFPRYGDDNLILFLAGT